MMKPHSVHDAVLLEVIRQVALEVGLAEASVEKLCPVLLYLKPEAVVHELDSVFILHHFQRRICCARDGEDYLVAALCQGVGVSIIGEATDFVRVWFRRRCLFGAFLLWSAGGEERDGTGKQED